MLRHMHSLACLFGFCYLFAPESMTSEFSTFNPFPQLPYEATTHEQDDWVKVAKQILGDGIEREPLDACQKLIDDRTTPFELKRWATLQQMRLFSYIRQEPIALDIAARWLAQYNAVDPNPLAIRSVCTKIVSQRLHDTFKPTFEEKRLVFEDLFRNHPGNEWDVINAHLDFAQLCNYRFAETREARLLEERVAHLMLAESKVREHIAAALQTGDDRLREFSEKTLRERVTPQLDGAIQALEHRIATDRLRPPQDRPQPAQGRPGAPSSPPRP